MKLIYGFLNLIGYESKYIISYQAFVDKNTRHCFGHKVITCNAFFCSFGIEQVKNNIRDEIVKTHPDVSEIVILNIKRFWL